MGYAGNTSRPRGRLATLVKDVLPHLTSIRLLDLGQDTGNGLISPELTMIHNRLTYLRVSLQDIAHLYHVMSSKTLPTTLKQFHATMRHKNPMCDRLLPEDLILPPMINLHTFTLVQTILSYNRYEWSTFEYITAPDHMPVLRRVNLAIFTTIDELDQINSSLLFTDDRRIDVQFAFAIDDDSLGIQLSHQVPHGSRFHPRQVVGVTCVVSELCSYHEHSTDMNCYVSIFI